MSKKMTFDEKVEMCACCNINNDFADLQMKYDKVERHIKLLNSCLDVKEENYCGDNDCNSTDCFIKRNGIERLCTLTSYYSSGAKQWLESESEER